MGLLNYFDRPKLYFGTNTPLHELPEAVIDPAFAKRADVVHGLHTGQVCATPDLKRAALYTLDKNLVAEATFDNGRGKPAHYVVIERPIPEDLCGYVYQIDASKHGFEPYKTPSGFDTGEWRTNQKVPVGTPHKTIKSPQDIMDLDIKLFMLRNPADRDAFLERFRSRWSHPRPEKFFEDERDIGRLDRFTPRKSGLVQSLFNKIEAL